MESIVPIVQQVLTAFTNVDEPSNTTTTNGTASATPITSSPLIPTDLSSLVAFLYSFAALRDWLKLLVIGTFFEACRRFSFSLYHKIIDSFFLTVYFKEDDSSYDWMMFWLSRQPSWATAREVQISTKSFGLSSAAVLVPGEEEDAGSVMSGSRKLAYLPNISATYTLWYKRRRMTVTRITNQTGYYGGHEETLQISILTRRHSFLNELLLEAKKMHTAAQENHISIHVSDANNNWRHVASRPKRPMRSIVLDPGIKDVLIDDARDFLESKAWYSARGIPFRRGYLLYGAPGSGKTSIIHSMAGELGLDVYVISLSRVGLDDTSLSELISELPEKCIALMEDIDAAFSQTLNRDAPVDPQPKSSDPNEKPPAASSTSRISLSGLLNALDGVGAQEGRILYATTNKYLALDPALCRPGRMDIHVEFKLASKFQANELYRRFYIPMDEDTEDDDEKENPTEKDEANLIDLDEKVTPSEEPKPGSIAPVFTGNSHRTRAPKLGRRQVTALATQFSNIIPERQFSMASLQGYLMSYKTRPFEAVKDAEGWVKRELADRLAKTAAQVPPIKTSPEP